MNTVWHYNFGWLYKLGSLNAKVKIASFQTVPFFQFSMPLSSQWACPPLTCGTGSSCWWWRRASVEDATVADSYGGSASCISHTERKMVQCYFMTCLLSRSNLSWFRRRLLLNWFFSAFKEEKESTSTYMIGLFSCVDAQVALQRLQVTEACSTDLTRIWLLTRVDQHMGTQMSNLKHEQTT